MRISINTSTGLAKVIEPTFDEDIYLSEAVLDSLQKSGVFNKLENMNFIIDFSQKRWEISDEPPVGVPGTIASVIFHVGGSFTKDDTRMICDLDN